MTERVNAILVTLDKDIREDDVQCLVKAIECLRNVASVDVNVVELQSHIAYARARSDLVGKIWDVLKP